jgi:MFS family permease
MTGPTIGLLLGPPLGGTLNETLGYRSPFILAIILCAFDLFGRLLVMERHEAQKWKDVGISASEKSSIDEVKKIGMSHHFSLFKSHIADPNPRCGKIPNLVLWSDSNALSLKACAYCLLEHVHIRVSWLHKDQSARLTNG